MWECTTGVVLYILLSRINTGCGNKKSELSEKLSNPDNMPHMTFNTFDVVPNYAL